MQGNTRAAHELENEGNLIDVSQSSNVLVTFVACRTQRNVSANRVAEGQQSEVPDESGARGGPGVIKRVRNVACRSV